MDKLLTLSSLLVLAVTALPAQGPVNDLHALIEKSDVIAIVKVDSVQSVAERVVTVEERSYAGHFKQATVESVCPIKGTLPKRLSISYSTISSIKGGGWVGGVPRGHSIVDELEITASEPSTLRLVFLKRSDDGYIATDGTYLAMTVFREKPGCESESEAIRAVIRVLEDTVVSRFSTPQEKDRALKQLYVSDESSIVPFLREFLAVQPVKTPDGLRAEAIAALLHKGDRQTLETAVFELIDKVGTGSESAYLYAISTGDFHTEDIATLASLLDSPIPERRRAGAQALRHIGGEVAADKLKRFLNDPDELVRVNAFYCVDEAQNPSHKIK